MRRSWRCLSTGTARSTPSINPLPKMPQTLGGLSTNWRAAQMRFGSPPRISPPFGDVERTEEHRRRVSGWTPIVRVTSDARLRIALVGRMSSGKSSLFNAIVATEGIGGPSPKQIAHSFRGMTRDSVEGYGTLSTRLGGDMHLTVIDTPGIVDGTIVEEAMRSISTADVVIMVCAVDEDLSDEERRLAVALRDEPRPTLIVVNKIDLVQASERDAVLLEYSELGLGQALALSTITHEGIPELSLSLEPPYQLHEVQRTLRDWDTEDVAMEGDASALEEVRDRNNFERFIRVAIVGRTNSGKSSLLNRLVGFERSRAAEGSHTTRDPVTISATYRGRKLQLIDTAGMCRMRTLRHNEFANLLHNLTINAIRFAHVVVVVFDATEGQPSRYDMSLLHKAIEEGRPFVMCATKWDAVLDASATAEAIDYKLKRQVKEVKYGTAVACSAVTGENLTLLMDEILKRYDTWNKHIRAAELSRFWRQLERSVVIPSHVSRIGRLRQISTRPPTFLLQLQTRDDRQKYPRAMQEMVKNALAEEFDFKGVPIRLVQDIRDNHPDYI